MTCKECIHNGLCVLDNTFNDCPKFKDKSKFIELPCNKDELYSIKTHYKSGKKELYAIVEYYCQKNKPKKIAEYKIVGKELIENKDIKCFEWLPSTNFKVLQDGFLTKEEAERALKERERK